MTSNCSEQGDNKELLFNVTFSVGEDGILTLGQSDGNIDRFG